MAVDEIFSVRTYMQEKIRLRATPTPQHARYIIAT